MDAQCINGSGNDMLVNDLVATLQHGKIYISHMSMMVRDMRLIMDRNSRRSKGVGYIEFYDAMYVPMAIALSGYLLLGQPVMVKPSEAEKNLVQSTAKAGRTDTCHEVKRSMIVEYIWKFSSLILAFCK
ncbi:hypothetical protein L2E82_12990 [Cichorium intybus]|uniref:Uncharacterized protein n=1 Tax=Cichorium intybus TaxID=13427 RepID=A0ACB9GI94_CICIN|nr:hypothetical protein L2E82_12990 [Cichorium intybus]